MNRAIPDLGSLTRNDRRWRALAQLAFETPDGYFGPQYAEAEVEVRQFLDTLADVARRVEFHANRGHPSSSAYEVQLLTADEAAHCVRTDLVLQVHRARTSTAPRLLGETGGQR